MNKILLVEDEKNFAHVLRDYLGMNGYEVTLATNGEEGSAAFNGSRFGLCLLDVMMLRKDGFSLAEEIRQKDRDVPLIFLTARGMREDMIRGYRLGADDYIVKPFDSEVLLLKIRAIMNRKNGSPNDEQQVFIVGDFSFNAKLRTLSGVMSTEVRLSPKESQLLKLLCLHCNDVLTREKALKQIWKDDNYFTARSMDVYIVKLRKFLSADARISISNVHGNGYSLQVKV
jgi:two-component system, OmpR family, response regulator